MVLLPQLLQGWSSRHESFPTPYVDGHMACPSQWATNKFSNNLKSYLLLLGLWFSSVRAWLCAVLATVFNGWVLVLWVERLCLGSLPRLGINRGLLNFSSLYTQGSLISIYYTLPCGCCWWSAPVQSGPCHRTNSRWDVSTGANSSYHDVLNCKGLQPTSSLTVVGLRF